MRCSCSGSAGVDALLKSHCDRHCAIPMLRVLSVFSCGLLFDRCPSGPLRKYLAPVLPHQSHIQSQKAVLGHLLC